MSSGNIRQTGQMASPGLPPYHVFTLEEIKDATNNFDTINLVGEGSQGQVKKLFSRVCLMQVNM